MALPNPHRPPHQRQELEQNFAVDKVKETISFLELSDRSAVYQSKCAKTQNAFQNVKCYQALQAALQKQEVCLTPGRKGDAALPPNWTRESRRCVMAVQTKQRYYCKPEMWCDVCVNS